MGITSAWSISAHDDAFIAAMAPRLLPLIAAEQENPIARERWDRWQREPLPDFRTWWKPGVRTCQEEAEAVHSFHELTASGEHVQKMYDGLSPEDDFSLITDVWEQVDDAQDIFLSVHTKEYALRSFFHAIGPVRAALFPGWCGNFLLTHAEVRATLPAVERALGFTPGERAMAEEQDWLDYPGSDEESVLDGPLRMWRQAAADGRGLCGVSVVIY
ncbi:hypothetical protein AB0B21_33210 [Streptomyces rimosus]|uniref:hypothetical protein n=1 Tax=Streptomyces rimosus TaxID=1927 RepID=UPI000519AE0E|nr:hypothetical protein [Streptomyces rimosus]